MGGVLSYEDMLYQRISRGRFEGAYRGLPLTRAAWCKKLKADKVDIRGYLLSSIEGGDIRISNPKRELVFDTQANKNMGFATRWSQYCTGELKNFFQALARRAV